MQINLNLSSRLLCSLKKTLPRSIGDIWLFGITLVVITIFYVLTLRAGHYWVGDDLQYIQHAINLVEGKPYINPLYISNAVASVGPMAYPPIFPLILSVIYVVFGLNFIAIKVALISFFISALSILKASLKQYASTITIIFIILYLGFNPEFWDFKDRILSEFPFVCFSLLALFLMQISDLKQSYAYAALLGVTMYLSYGIREIALILPLVLITYELWHYRKVTIYSILAMIIFVLLVIVQKLSLGLVPIPVELNQQLDLLVDSGSASPTTFSYVNLSFENIFKQGVKYFWSLYHILQIRFLPYSGYFYLIVNICVLTGYLKALFQKIRFIEIYFVGYLCALLLFAGYDGFRYLMPILPFYIMYLFTGFLKLASLCNHTLKLSLVGLLLIMYINIAGFLEKESNFVSQPTYDVKLDELFSFISEHTQATDVIVAMQPRVIAFFTQRQASTYPGHKPEEFMKYLRAIQAKYLVTSPSLQKPQNTKEVDWVLTHHDSELFLVFDNETFKVFNIESQKANIR
jgi:hypothetical protein